jgi:hypothetical protein
VKKLLYQFDIDPLPAVFDNVVGYDGGADHITAYGGVTAANVGGLVEGAIFTRGPRTRRTRRSFHRRQQCDRGSGGARRRAQEVFCQIPRLGDVRLQWRQHHRGRGRGLARIRPPAQGKRAVVLAGTGPVGQRAAALLAREGAAVAITGRKLEVVQSACDAIKSRFGADVKAIAAPTNAERGSAIEGAEIVLATGAAGITLLEAKRVAGQPTLELVADANASPPAGIEGVALGDRGTTKPRQDPVRAARLRRPQARAAPRLHRTPVRTERPVARCRRNLCARQNHGRVKSWTADSP